MLVSDATYALTEHRFAFAELLDEPLATLFD
jgi:hypothetical protein